MTVPFILVCDHRGSGVEETLQAILTEGYRLETTASLRQTLARLEADAPDLLVVDPLAPENPAELEAVDRIRARSQPLPLLVVAEGIGPLPRLPRWERGSGAWDVIARGASADEWRLRLARLAELTGMLDEQRELRHRASHDDRTDLLRPAAFQTRLEEHFSAAQRHDFSLALVLIDLDDFGVINKRHDHTVGDVLISQVGEVIRGALRTEDVAGRLGGDEFAVLLPYTRKVDAAAVVNRLCREIHALSGRPTGAKEDIKVGGSLGFETFDGKDLESVSELRLHAERALRESKLNGGNQGTYYRTLVRGEAPASASDVE